MAKNYLCPEKEFTSPVIYREPLRTLIGKFEAQFLRERHAANTARSYSDSFRKFFAKYPRKSNPHQFALADTVDYQVWRKEDGAAYSTIRFELCCVKAFFSWLIEEVPGYEDMANPVVIPPWPEPQGQPLELQRPRPGHHLASGGRA